MKINNNLKLKNRFFCEFKLNSGNLFLMKLSLKKNNIIQCEKKDMKKENLKSAVTFFNQLIFKKIKKNINKLI